MSVRFEWHGNKFLQTFDRATDDGLKAAALHYHTNLRLAVNTSNQRGTNPSSPGNPPHKRTGFGQQGIVWEFSPESHAARVGIRKNAMYMFYLELGTRRILPRPFMVPTLTRLREQLGRLACTQWKGQK